MTQRQRLTLITALIIGLLVGLIAFTVYAFYSDSRYDIDKTYVTNVTDSGLTIVWTSKNQYYPQLLYKEEGSTWLPVVSQRMEGLIDDRDRDNQDQKNRRYSHHISVGKLKPNTAYEFKIRGIVVGKKIPVVARTTPLREELNTPDPAYGSLSGVDPRDAVVIFQKGDGVDSKLASAPVAPNQTYTLDLEPFQPIESATGLRATVISRRTILPSYKFKQPEFKPFETIKISYKSGKEPIISGKPNVIDEAERGEDTVTGNNGVSDVSVLPDYTGDDDIPETDIELGSDASSDIDEETVVEESDPEVQIPDSTASDRVQGNPSRDDGVTGTPGDGPEIPDDGTDAPEPPLPASGDIIDVPRTPLNLPPVDDEDVVEPAEEHKPQNDNLEVCVVNESVNQHVAKGKSSPVGNLPEKYRTINAQSNPVQGAAFNYIEVAEEGRIGFFEQEDKVAEKDITFDREQRRIKVRLYYDTNANGRKDNEEVYMLSYSDIIYRREAISVKFRLNAGWNLIHLPLIDTRVDTRIDSAKKLINYWERQSADIKHIAKFEGGRFIFTSKRESGKYYGEDFQLLPGDGLFVFSLRYDSDVTFSGNEYESAVPLALVNGWNLVGIFNPEQEYTSDSLITALEAQNYTASTVSQYENGLYRSVVKDQNTVFGNNFNIIKTRGYFIRIEDSNAEEFIP